MFSVHRVLGIKNLFRPNFQRHSNEELPRKRAKNPSGDHSNDNLNDHQKEKNDQGENSENFDPSGDKGYLDFN